MWVPKFDQVLKGFAFFSTCLCLPLLGISRGFIMEDKPFYTRFEFDSSLSHYQVPHSVRKLQPNHCMAGSTPACGTPAPLTTATGCQQKCSDSGHDEYGSAGMRRLQVAEDSQHVDRRRLQTCHCKYTDEYPAYPTDVLTGAMTESAGCPAEMAALLKTGACTCDEAIETAIELCFTSALLALAPIVLVPAAWGASRCKRGRAPSALTVLIFTCWIVCVLSCLIIAAILGLYVVTETSEDICGDQAANSESEAGGLAQIHIIVTMTCLLAALHVTIALICVFVRPPIPFVSEALARLRSSGDGAAASRPSPSTVGQGTAK